MCQSKDLVLPGNNVTNTSYRGRGRGSAVKRYNTRNSKQPVNSTNTHITQSEVPTNVQANTSGQLLDLNTSANEPNVPQPAENSLHNATYRIEVDVIIEIIEISNKCRK